MCSNNRDITAKDLSEMGLTLKLGTKKYPKLGIKNTLVFLTEPVQMFFDSWFSDTSFSIIYINTYSRWACCHNTDKRYCACCISINWSLRACFINTNWGPQQLVSAATGVYVHAVISTPTEPNMEQLVSTSTGVYSGKAGYSNRLLVVRPDGSRPGQAQPSMLPIQFN